MKYIKSIAAALAFSVLACSASGYAQEKIVVKSVAPEAADALGAASELKIGLFKTFTKKEKMGFVREYKLPGATAGCIVASIDKFTGENSESSTEPPTSRLVCYDGRDVIMVDDFSVYLESLDTADFDSDGVAEIFFARRGGMKMVGQCFVAKCELDKDKKAVFKTIFRSPGNSGSAFNLAKGGQGEPVRIIETVESGSPDSGDGQSQPAGGFVRVYGFKKSASGTGEIGLIQKYDAAAEKH